MRHGIKPIRVHSSGDFFSLKYAEMWMDVAKRVYELDPTVRFWAPTRTHVLKAFADFWATPGRVPENFIIRPSAYHVGDVAPSSPGLAKGTSVLDEDQTRVQLARGDGQRRSDGSMFNFQCGVYALERGNKTCVSSIAHDGKVGCRVCWMRPDLAVNYAFH